MYDKNWRSERMVTSQYVIDTHALVWYLGGSPLLPAKARGVLEQIDQGQATGLVPVLVLAEAVRLFEKSKTTLSLQDLLRVIGSNPNYTIVSLNIDHLKEAV